MRSGAEDICGIISVYTLHELFAHGGPHELTRAARMSLETV
jgi:hypothetical protein